MTYSNWPKIILQIGGVFYKNLFQVHDGFSHKNLFQKLEGFFSKNPFHVSKGVFFLKC